MKKIFLITATLILLGGSALAINHFTKSDCCCGTECTCTDCTCTEEKCNCEASCEASCCQDEQECCVK